MTRLAAAALVLATGGISACSSDRYVIGGFPDTSCSDHRDALFCSGFERPDLSDWSEVIVQDDAGVAQTEARSAQGRGSLHASSRGPRSVAVVAREFGPVTEGDLYLRASLYIPSGLDMHTMNVFFIGDYAAPDPFAGVDFNLESGVFSTYVPGQDPNRPTDSTFQIPRDAWFCMSMHMGVSKDAGSVVISVDGNTALQRRDMKTLPDGGVHLLRIGVDWSSEQETPFDIFLDDLVLSTEAVNCE